VLQRILLQLEVCKHGDQAVGKTCHAELISVSNRYMQSN
jgi:hypothetical protein